MTNRVWCYAGHKYPERPTAFLWEETKLTVSNVQSAWKTENTDCFLVNTTSGRRFLLQYDRSKDSWHIQLMDVQDE